MSNIGITVTFRRIALEVAMPGQLIWEFTDRLRQLAGSWPGEFEFPDRYYSHPDGLNVRFLIAQDMEESFSALLRSFAEEKGLTFSPSGAAHLVRTAA